ncbi:MAG: tRNA (N6-isopentenyl adenosine(37)-C2)-methylthiotransferase MiaB [Candidatus Latescibacterota bacterium]|jgi:tRNA-2-methylthio-N6-dimethylallyladenosine synthase|nr:MAG: tRNA (N6-isopentenyl adenosine(37)-C2)-methylthiotransferase MiaB [Candidatus Latescibacterota bacterium]
MKDVSFYTESFGCQMNAYDTEVISSLLAACGAREVSSPEEADCIVVNTCSVRDHAERRAIGRLLDLSRHRRAMLAVCGCMAQRLGEDLFDIVPSVRVIAGTAAYAALPMAIERALSTGERFALLDDAGEAAYEILPRAGPEGVSRYVAITRGCESYCSYCIVPYLRGPLRSRSASSIVEEVGALERAGAREITLLGQNVIAYRDGEADFPALARRILDETGIPRLRFLTSHPRDVTADIFDLMASQPRLCGHMHLPVQSGNDRVLAAMNRGYTRDRYLALLAEGRSRVPDLAVTSDVIVGFPGETPREFDDTIDLVRRARFDSAFTFMYSARAGTAAAAVPDDVSSDEKKRRLAILNEAVQEERGRILRSQLGATAEILLDGAVEKGETRWLKGRTPQFRNVLVRADAGAPGGFVRVVLSRLVNFTFEGEPVEAP